MSTRRIEPKKRSVRTRGSKLNLNADHAQHVVDDEGGDDDDDVLDSPKELSKDRSPPPPAPPPLSDGDAKKSGDDESSSESGEAQTMSTSTPVRSASSKAAPLRSASKKTRHGSILNTAGAPSSQPSSGSLSFSLMSPRETSSVPDVEWTRDGDRRILRWASLKQILQCYSETSTAPDTLSLRHLILAHAHFVQSSALLDQLIKAYNRLSDPSGIPTASQMRLLNVVKTWIEMCYPALVEDPVCKKLLESFTAHLAATPSTAGLANLLNAAIESYKSKLNSPCFHLLGLYADDGNADVHKGPPDTMPPLVPLNSLSTRLVDYDPLEVARQLCLIDHELLAAIPLHELHKKRWTTENAPSIEAASVFGNKLAYWLADQILSEEKTKSQLKAFQHLVILGKHLLELQNFNSLFAVYLALNLKAVKSLRIDWNKLLPKKILSTLKKIEQINSPLDNFGGYRAFVRGLQPPMIPCQEIVLKDLLYQTDYAGDFHEEHVNVINLLKLDSLGKCLSPIISCQLPRYCLRRDALVYQMLQTIATMDKKEWSKRAAAAAGTPNARVPAVTLPGGHRANKGTTEIEIDVEEEIEYQPYVVSDDEADEKSPRPVAESEQRSRTLPGTKRTTADTPKEGTPAAKEKKTDKPAPLIGTPSGAKSGGEEAGGMSGNDDLSGSDEDKTAASGWFGGSLRDFLTSPRSPFRTIRLKDRKKEVDSDKEKDKSEKEKLEKERERLEKDKEALAKEKEKLEKEKAENLKEKSVGAEKEKEKEKHDKDKAEKEKHDKDKAEKERLDKEKQDKEIAAKAAADAAAAASAAAAMAAPPPAAEKWIVIRKFEKRGGVKVKLPPTLDELIKIGSQELGVEGVRVREVSTEALIKNLEAIEEGTILWLMTTDEEKNFD